MEFQANLKRLSLSLTISKDVPEKVYTDEKRYKQILFNLVGNALKFTYRGFVDIKISLKDNNLVTQVRDSGIGIKENDINKLFRFFGKLDEVKNNSKGEIGLGLTISKLIVEHLNGNIYVDSKENKGSCFTFVLPIEKSSTQSLFDVSQEEEEKSKHNSFALFH